MVATDVADAVAEGTDGTGIESGEAGEGQNGTAKKASGFYVPAPSVLRERLEAEATAAGKPVAAFVRDLLAAHWGLQLPEIRTRTKYSSPEEKAAATKAKQQERNELIKQLLAEHKAKMEAAASASASE